MIRIRRCHGNRECWLLARVSADGSESDSYGSYTTGYSIDRLLTSPAARHLLTPGEPIELIWEPLP